MTGKRLIQDRSKLPCCLHLSTATWKCANKVRETRTKGQALAGSCRIQPIIGPSIPISGQHLHANAPIPCRTLQHPRRTS